MGWERRGNRLYLYQKIRDGNHVRSRYAHRGGIPADMAEYLAELKQEERRQAADRRRQERQRRAEHEAIDRKVQAVTLRITEHLAAVLVACGYHYHRGEWRKRRGTD